MHHWIPRDPVSPTVGADVMPTSSVILGVLENLGDRLPWGVVGMSTGPVPKYAQDTSQEGRVHVYSLGDELISGSSGNLVDYYCCSYYGVENPFITFSPFSNSSIVGTLFRLMVG